MSIKDLMTPKVITLREDDSVAFAIGMLERCQIEGAPITNIRGSVLGVVYKQDLANSRLLKLLRVQEHDLDRITVGQVMHMKAPLIFDEETSLAQAAQAMLQAQEHHGFVQNPKGRICGMVSSLEVLQALSLQALSLLHEYSVQQTQTQEPQPEASQTKPQANTLQLSSENTPSDAQALEQSAVNQRMHLIMSLRNGTQH